MEIDESDLSALIKTTTLLTKQLELMLVRGKQKGLDCENCKRFKSCESYSESSLKKVVVEPDTVESRKPESFVYNVPSCGPSC